MARNWLRHHVDAQDGQVVIRKTVVSPTVTSPSSVSETVNGAPSMTPEEARAMVERARKLREARQRRIATTRVDEGQSIR